MNTPTNQPVTAKVIKQPSKRLLFWGLVLTLLAASSLAQSEPGWIKLDSAPGGWDWGRLVDMVLMCLGLAMVSDWAHRTAAWVRSR